MSRENKNKVPNLRSVNYKHYCKNMNAVCICLEISAHIPIMYSYLFTSLSHNAPPPTKKPHTNLHSCTSELTERQRGVRSRVTTDNTNAILQKNLNQLTLWGRWTPVVFVLRSRQEEVRLIQDAVMAAEPSFPLQAEKGILPVLYNRQGVCYTGAICRVEVEFNYYFNLSSV